MRLTTINAARSKGHSKHLKDKLRSYQISYQPWNQLEIFLQFVAEDMLLLKVGISRLC